MKKVKSKFLNALFVLFCLGVVFASCSTDLVEKEDEEKIELTPESFKTNFSESGYHNALNNVTNVLMSTRSTQLSEEIVQKAIEPFVLDGKYLKEQILQDKSTDEEDEEKLDGLNDSQLAVLSLFANALIYDVDFGNDGAASTRAAVNKELLCLADALVGHWDNLYSRIPAPSRPSANSSGAVRARSAIWCSTGCGRASSGPSAAKPGR